MSSLPLIRPGGLDEFQRRLAARSLCSPLEQSEIRAAQIARERFGSIIRFNVDRRSWMHYSDGYWQLDVAGAVVEYVKAVAADAVDRLIAADFKASEATKIGKALQSANGVKSVLKLLETEPGIPLRADELDRDIWALNVKNGTIDLRSGTLRPHDRDDLISRRIGFSYDPASTCPLWLRTLETIFEGDASRIAYLQRILGLAASGDISVQEFYVWYGSGANGKSVVIDTAMFCLGEYAAVAPESLLIARAYGSEHPTELASLQGRRLVTATETEDGATLRLQLIKKMTGDATMTARVMRGNFFSFTRTHKLILATNNRPRIRENTEAAWRRIRLLPFTVTIPPEDRDEKLSAKLQAEAPGILAWIVRGSIDRLKHGMTAPEAVTEATNAYRADSDSFGEFVESELIKGPKLRVTRKEIVEQYNSWVIRSGEADPLNEKAVYEAMRKVPGVQDDAWKLAGVKVRGFTGAGLAWQNGGNPNG